MSSRARASFVLIAAGGVFLTACGLIFSPGEYSDGPVGSPPLGDGAPNVTDTSVTGETSSDAPAQPSGTRILLMGGRRNIITNESSAGYVSETIRTTFNSTTGEIGALEFELGPPVGASWARAEFMSADSFFLQRDTSSVYIGKVTEGKVANDWTSLALRGSIPENGLRGWLVDAGVLATGGFNGSTPTTNVYLAPFNLGDGGIDPFASIDESQLIKARSEVTLHRVDNFLFAVGGRDKTDNGAPGLPDVELATIANGKPGTFAASTNLVNPATGAAHNIMLPLIATGSGWFFVIGGQTNAYSSSITDVVLASKMDPTTGALGPWVAATKFPTTIAGTAALVIDNWLLVFGGITPTGASDAIMGMQINADGSFAAWKRVGSFSAGRSGIVAVRY